MYGRQDHNLSPTETWEECSCLVREAQKRSRALYRFQMLRSPTWGPSGVEIRMMDLAGQGKAIPLRIGRVMEEMGMRGEDLMVS
jgi:hypothetical protein